MIASLILLMLSAHGGETEGKAIYVAKCQACHGADGKGDGPAARALPKKPRDFSDPKYWKDTSDKTVRAVITNGKPGSIMRGFPMPDGQLNDLVAYLKSLETPE